ncbi:Phosphotriesterase-related protein [Balamuthia mandrillaris]
MEGVGGALAGKIQTVQGVRDPQEFTAPILPHEHLLIDFNVAYCPQSHDPVVGGSVTQALCCTSFAATEAPSSSSEDSPLEAEFTLQSIGYVRYQPYSHRANLKLEDLALAIKEVNLFKKAGGQTIVDATTQGIARNPDALLKISQETGVHIVMGAGYYVGATHPSSMDGMTEEELCKIMVDEVLEGLGENKVKCGVIGEIGCSYPLYPNEIKVLKAAAKAQQITGAPLLIHPGRHEYAPIEIVKILQEAGADITRTAMSHLDRTVFKEETLMELAKTGIYLEYDLFGVECSFYQLNEKVDMPSDAERIHWLLLLKQAGYLDRILLAHDIHTKHRLVEYGGHGYAHLLVNVAEKMEKRGFTLEELRTMFVANPRRFLTFATPSSATAK